jgi:hypothetical protein
VPGATNLQTRGKAGMMAVEPVEAANQPPSPNIKNIAETLDIHFGKKIKEPPDGTLFAVDDVFRTLATYWTKELRTDRFERPTEPAAAALLSSIGQVQLPNASKTTGDEYRASTDADTWLLPEVAVGVDVDDSPQPPDKRLHVLYRAEITNKLFEAVESSFELGLGIIVQGPQGIGKSHSLVNLVLKLQATGKYLVTFIPDCFEWTGIHFLLRKICGSFDIDLTGIGWVEPGPGTPEFREEHFHSLFTAIDSALARKGRKWVFVFDQVNAILSREKRNQIADLSFPYTLIRRVLSRDRVASVTSVSSNNEVSLFRDEKFIEFNHTIEMTDDELRQALLGRSSTGWQISLADVKKLAGGVPGYVKKYLDNPDPEIFIGEVLDEVGVSVSKLISSEIGIAGKMRWESRLDSIVCSVLGQPTSRGFYDMKYLLPKYDHDLGLLIYKPLFPAVIDAYRHIFFGQILNYVGRHEGELVSLCNKVNISNDVIGRLFEYLVIQRIKSKGLKRKALLLVMQSIKSNCKVSDVCDVPGHSFSIVDGQLLPPWPSQKSGFWVPRNSNFPAINFFVKSKTVVVAFQVHVASPTDATHTFFQMCRAADWFRPDRQIILVYLSPNVTAKCSAGALASAGSFADLQHVDPKDDFPRRSARLAAIDKTTFDYPSTPYSPSKKKARKEMKQDTSQSAPFEQRVLVCALTAADLGLEGLTWCNRKGEALV